MTPAVKSVTLPGGVTLPYVEQGDPSGPPVLLLHGITDSRWSFEPVLPHLSRSLHVFALSQRGHGDASRPVTGYAPQDFAADVAAFLDALGLRKAVLVGHSMGGTVAQRFALDYPEQTMGLALVASFVEYRSNPVIAGYCDTVVATLTDPIPPAVARAFQESTLARPLPPALLDIFVQESLKVPARVWKAAFRGLLDHEIAEELGRIVAPTVMFWGDRDAFVPRDDQDRLLASIPGAERLLIYGGAGHALHWEQPARFAAHLQHFVNSLSVEAQRGPGLLAKAHAG
jgi:non-heme chloroperoxidase